MLSLTNCCSRTTRHIALVGLTGVLALGVPSHSGNPSKDMPPARDEHSVHAATERGSVLPSILIQSEGLVPANARAAITSQIEPAAREEAAPLSVDRDMDISNIERIRLRVWGFTDFSGEYSVELGSMSVPGLGRISVIGRTVTSLENYLSARLSSTMRREISVSIEAARYQPFYTTGQVARAGALEWRPGLTLIQAVALAGGVARPAGTAGDDTPERAMSMQQIRAQLEFALAQYERLKTEKAGAGPFRPSAKLARLIEQSTRAGGTSMASLVANQNHMLDQQRATLQTQVASLEREHSAALQDLEAAEVQGRVASEQAELAREVMAGLTTLRQRGVIANSRYMAQQSDVLTSEVRLAESAAQVERARARLASLERQITMRQQERQGVLNDRIEALEREIAQHELTLTSVRRPADPDGRPSVEFNIARVAGSGIDTMSADLFTKIMPGDVIIISSSGSASTADVAAAPVDLVPSREPTSTVALSRAQRFIEASSNVTSVRTQSADRQASDPTFIRR